MSGIKTDTSGREVYNLDTSGSGGGTGGSVTIDQSTPGTTNGVVVNSSALPTGGATSAAQTTGNSSLASIDTKLTSPLGVVGSVASGATDSGNPVKVAGRYNSTLPTLMDGQRGDLQTGSRGSLNVQLKVADGSGSISSTSTPADGASNSVTNLNTSTYQMGYNGTTWDRMRGDTSGLLVQHFALTG